MNKLNTLVSAKWLHGCLIGRMNNMRIFDSSFHLPNSNRDAKAEYAERHIPGASFFDIDECADKTSQFSHMLPRKSHFEDFVGNLGVNNNTHVIVYDNCDNHGFFSAQRLWWTFRVFGHETVSILNGGFPRWCLEGYPTTSEVPLVTKQKYSAVFNKSMVKSFEDVVKNISDKKFQVVDARGPGRFYGTDTEPRKGMNSGHIVGSVNMPFKTFINPETKEFKDPEDLKKMFAESKVDISKPIIATCGSGVTACCVALAGHLTGAEVSVYDGSWTEWSVRSEPHQRVSPESPEE